MLQQWMRQWQVQETVCFRIFGLLQHVAFFWDSSKIEVAKAMSSCSIGMHVSIQSANDHLMAACIVTACGFCCLLTWWLHALSQLVIFDNALLLLDNSIMFCRSLWMCTTEKATCLFSVCVWNHKLQNYAKVSAIWNVVLEWRMPLCDEQLWLRWMTQCLMLCRCMAWKGTSARCVLALFCHWVLTAIVPDRG